MLSHRKSNSTFRKTKHEYCQAQPSPFKQRLVVARSARLRLALLSLLHPGIVVLRQEIFQIQKTLINNNSPTNQTKGNRDNNRIE